MRTKMLVTKVEADESTNAVIITCSSDNGGAGNCQLVRYIGMPLDAPTVRSHVWVNVEIEVR